MVERTRDLDLLQLDAWIIHTLGLGLLAKPAGPVAAQGAVQLRPILPKYRGPGCYPHRDAIHGKCGIVSDVSVEG